MAVQEENILAMTMNNRRKMPTTIKALECEVTNSVSFWVTFLVSFAALPAFFDAAAVEPAVPSNRYLLC